MDNFNLLSIDSCADNQFQSSLRKEQSEITDFTFKAFKEWNPKQKLTSIAQMAIGDPVTCIIEREKQFITNKGKDTQNNHPEQAQNSSQNITGTFHPAW